jgi:hypothetical protein
MMIGGMHAADRRLQIEANFPYSGLVDLICKAWEKSGFSREFRPPQCDYLVKVTVKDA